MQEVGFVGDKGTETGWVKRCGIRYSPLTELIYARYDRQLFTIATSNLSESDLRERYGDRIADRLQEMFERIHYRNKSYRK